MQTEVKISNEGRGNWIVGLFNAPDGDEVEFCTSGKEARAFARKWAKQHSATVTDESLKVASK